MGFRFIAVSQERIEQKEWLGSAIYLHEFLTDHQTSADGWVYYGKEFGYAWIRAHWLAAPPLRTLKRHMALLKKHGLVEVHRTFHGGIRVRLLRSVKFAKPLPPAAVQMSLFGSRVSPIRGGTPVENPVDKHLKSCESTDFNSAKDGPCVGPPVAPERSKEQVKETIKAVAVAHSLPAAKKTPQELESRRRLLQDQAEMLKRKVKIS